jgi:hypothetical protein
MAAGSWNLGLATMTASLEDDRLISEIETQKFVRSRPLKRVQTVIGNADGYHQISLVYSDTVTMDTGQYCIGTTGGPNPQEAG